ncbi:MAG: hypothetical protein ABGZ24_23085, partial [Fuerstiella sp.]
RTLWTLPGFTALIPEAELIESKSTHNSKRNRKQNDGLERNFHSKLACQTGVSHFDSGSMD